MIYALSLVPLLILLAVLKFTDSFTLVTWKHTALSFCAGVIVCICALLTSRLFAAAHHNFYSPLVEEILKWSVLIVLVARRKIVFIQQALCYGAALGAGFAFAENIIYISAFSDMSAGTSVFRGLGTAVMHMACPMIGATFLTTAATLMETESKLKSIVTGASGLVIAIAIHALFNLLLLPMWAQLLATIFLFMLLVSVISSYNERCICRWLDQSITNDISLLSAIQEGNLSDTRQGRYLIEVKSQFDQETVVDMICYIRLYLELIIEDKSRLLLREAGLETPRTPEQKAQREADITEFGELRKRIGRTGESVLRPIVRLHRGDAALLLTN